MLYEVITVGQVAAVLGGKRDFAVHVLHVIPEPDPDYFDDKPARRLEWMAAQRKEAEAYLEEYQA